MNAVLNEVTQEHLKSDVTPFKVGDGVKVHTRVVEGGKERIQIFSGVVIALKGSGINRTFTVRRISYGEGVEKVFPVHSPLVSQIEVDKESKTMRARMYYLRDLVGKKAMQVKEKRLAKGNH
ncbi:MAG: 50S ribosomal protein L19 [Parvularcula sp.]|jgi:large subunit ribosomal protein L19|nr:50S ribosomal protein L19 [Parvularcula sp.]